MILVVFGFLVKVFYVGVHGAACDYSHCFVWSEVFVYWCMKQLETKLFSHILLLVELLTCMWLIEFFCFPRCVGASALRIRVVQSTFVLVILMCSLKLTAGSSV